MQLRSHRQIGRRLTAGELWQDTGAVFDANCGEHWFRITWLFTRFCRLRSRLELPATLRQHDLRHTAATYMLRQGIPIPTVSKILGHSNPAVTMRVYAHVLDDRELAASDLIDAMYLYDRDQILTSAD